MSRLILTLAGALAAGSATAAEPAATLDDHEQRLRALEQRLQAAPSANNAFNPALSLVLMGGFADYRLDPDNYALPGFQLGGHAGLAPEGLGLDHTELTLSANIDNLFYGQMTAALVEHDGEAEVELEEAYVDALALPAGLGLRFGRFFSGVGYLNGQHRHAWDFVDAPLAYRAFLGGQLADDGARLSWIAPTDLFVQLGAEALRGARFPAARHGGSAPGIYSAFVKLGGDWGVSHSWQLGFAHLSAEADARGGGHAHEGEPLAQFSGDSDLSVLDLVWKWAPDGNATRRQLILQGEYFERREDGTVSAAHDGTTHTGGYDGSQRGFYVQAVVQFQPRWRVGARYDRLWADNRGDDEESLEEAGLLDEGNRPQRYSLMLDHRPSEFSTLRLQYNRDESRAEGVDHQWLLQYVMTLGAHGAHRF